MTVFKYGNSWEKYPVKNGEVWKDRSTHSFVSVSDITKTLPGYMFTADMVYCDPPWNQGNVNAFYTKAGKKDYINSFEEFYSFLFKWIKKIKPASCYLEIGRQNKNIFIDCLNNIFPVVQHWGITYYGKNPCYLVRGGTSSQNFDFTGMDDKHTPFEAIKHETTSSIVGDLCTGQGLTAIAAYRLGKQFVGTELNQRRLAVTIDKVNKLGGSYESPVS